MDRKSGKSSRPARSEPTRERVLAAAERLLRKGSAGFGMRDLASEAQVSFATPFNLFGDKAAIMRALSAARIAAMMRRCAELPDAVAPRRVLEAIDIAVLVMLEEPDVNRVVMAWLGSPSAAPGQVAQSSRALWAAAIGEGEGLRRSLRSFAAQTLPDHLALAFRGALSFWTAGEITDLQLSAKARAAAASLLLAFSDKEGEEYLLQTISLASF